MPEIVVEPVASRGQQKQFLMLPWRLYAGDPHWVPPLRGHQRELAGFAKHPFFNNNPSQAFLAYRDGELCGRILGILNRNHVDCHQDGRGFFGFFECVDDVDVASGLFDAVRAWLAEHDIHRLRGPANPSLNYEVGLLIEGFDESPTFMMTYNRPYYAALIEAYGFTKAQDLYSYRGTLDMLPAIQAKLQPVAEQIVERYDVQLRPLDRSQFLEDVRTFMRIYNESLQSTWGFVPLTEDEVEHISLDLRHLIVPELTVIARVDDRLVGAVFAMPDYNPRIRKINGRLFPFGFIQLLANRRRISRARMISTNVIPEYQRMGIGLALMHALCPRAIDWGISEAEFSWVLESNLLSRGSLEKGGALRDKVYRVYDIESPDATGSDTMNRPRDLGSER